MAGENADRIAAALEGLARQMGELSARMTRLESQVQQQGEQKKDWQKTPEVQHVAETPVESLELASKAAEVVPIAEPMAAPIAAPEIEAAPLPVADVKPEPAMAQAQSHAAHVAPPPPVPIDQEETIRQASPVQPVRPVHSRAADFVARQQEAAANYVEETAGSDYQTRPAEAPESRRLEYEPPREYRQSPQAKSRWSVEQSLGKNWAAWIGGVVVVLGMLFFLKYAWDQGWIVLTPAMRIGAGVLVGVIFCAVGELMHIKKVPVLAATLHGVGLATVMASMFAAKALFAEPVLSPAAAFIGVLITGLVGIILSLHIRQMTLTIIALVGMYISPAVLSTGQDSSVGFMMYLCVVAALGVGVSILRPSWIAVRWVAWAGTWGWALLWVWKAPVELHVVLGIATPIVLLAMFLTENVMRVLSARKEPGRKDFLVPDMHGSQSLFFDTCALLATEWYLFERAHLPGLWVVPLALAGLMVAMYFATPAKMMRTMAAIMCCALLTLVVPLLFSFSSITLVWALMSAVVAVYAMMTGHVAARIWSVGLYCLVVVRFFAFDSQIDNINAAVFSIGRVHVTWWCISGWIIAAYGAGLARMQSIALAKARAIESGGVHKTFFDGALRGAPMVTALIAGLVVAAVGLRMMAVSPEATMAHALVLAVFGLSMRDPIARWAGTGVLAIASFAILGEQWQHADLREPIGMIGGWTISKWLILAWSASIMALLLGALARVRRRPEEAGLAEANTYFATGFFLVVSCMHFISQERFDPFSAVTLVGSLWAIGMLVLGWILQDKIYKNQVLVLMLMLVAKWSLMDGIFGSIAYSGTPVTPVVHLYSLSGLLIAAIIFFAELPPTFTRDRAIAAKSWMIGAMLFLWMNLEAIRFVDFLMKGTSSALGSPWIVKNMTLSVLWATYGFTCIVWGFVRRHASVRWAGLILLGVTVIKVLVVDMADVQTVMRILSFVVTGLLLLGVSFIYHKATSKGGVPADAQEIR